MTYDPAKMRAQSMPMIAPRTQMLLAGVLLTLGCVVMVLAAQGVLEDEFFASAIVIATTVFSLYSSLRSGREGQLDEWENATRNYAIGGGASTVVLGFAIYSVFASNLEFLWRPVADYEFGVLGMFMLAATMQIAVILAARRTPAYAADLDDDDD